jgi:molecular chaperone IbpA
MRTFDLSPLFRNTIGFDWLNDALDAAFRAEGSGPVYPPYDIEKLDKDQYRLTMAVAGFSPEDVEVTVEGNTLTIAGKAAQQEPKAEYLYRGIARRAFKRTFELAEHVKVADATLVNGLLQVRLVREVPEALKPRRIAVSAEAHPAAAIEAPAEKRAA